MIGNLAKTYSMLPSQVAAEATTFDLMVSDVLTTWENYQNNPEDMNNYRPEQLEELMRETKL